MKKPKQILAAFLCAAMLLAFVPAFSVSAEEYSGTCGDDLTWELDTDTGILTITGTGAMTNYSYNTSPWYYDRTNITTITISDGVTSIGDCAFYNCTGLTSITIPNSVTSIGTSAFYGCSALSEVNYDGSEDDWFAISFGYNNNYLYAACGLYLGSCGDDLTWRLSANTGILTISGTGDMYDYSYNRWPWYDYNTNIASVIIEDGVTSIGSYAFYDCSNLTSVTIPDSVTSIGWDAFYNCSNLKSVYITDITAWCNITFNDSVLASEGNLYLNGELAEEIIIPDGITSINNYAFYNCSSLKSITIPNTVTSIESYAFYGCSNLESITIPDSVMSIGSSAFSGTAYYNDESNWESDVLYIGNHLIAAKTSISGDYDIKSGTLTIVGFAFSSCSSLTSITIPDSVISIGTSAFQYCSNLESISIPDSITSIESYTFYECRNLKSISIPDSVMSIGYYAFNECVSLTNITIPDSVMSIGEYAFFGTAYYNDESNWESDVLYIGNHLIAAKTSISGDYDIKSGTLTIAEYAFSRCSNLTSITIPDSVTSISNYAFYGCSNLTSITIPAGITNVYNYAFYGCNSLNDVTYGGSDADWLQISISDGNSYLTAAYTSAHDIIASGECGNRSGDDLTWILRNGVLTIGGTGEMENYSSYSRVPWYSYATTITSVTIADGVTNIGRYAFYGCSNMTSITIPNSITSIGTNAFYKCTGLESVYITDLAPWCGISFSGTSSNPLYYGGNLYINGELAEEITIPDSVTSIASYAFPCYTALTSVTIPESVTNIGNYAFYRCTGLTNATIPESVTNIGTAAFVGCGSLNITAASGNPNYSSIDGVLFNKDQTEIVTYAKDVICPEYIIPDGVTSIGNYAFYYCTDLTDVTIPDSVTSIGSSAFTYCKSLTSVTIPDSVTSIGSYAFSMCSNLISIIIPTGVTSIEERVFYNCSNLTSITIPKSVTNIGESAFEYCSSLTDVYYGGTADEWSAITIDSYNTELKSASKHFSDDSSEITVFSGTCGDNLTWELDTETGILIISSTGAMADYEYEDNDGNNAPWGSYIDLIKSVVIEEGATSIGDCSFMNAVNLTSVTIPDTATRIGDCAFIYCLNLSGLTMGNNVTYIGDSAFEDCAFTSIVIPDTVTYIGDSAFSGCNNLTSATIGNGVTYIGSSAFSSTLLTSVAIPEGIDVIYNGTFRYCKNLKSVTIPRSVTYIEQGAFDDCTGLTDVYYNGSETAWECVVIDDINNDPIFNATVHYGMADYTEETYYSIGKYEDAAEAEVIIDEDGEVTINLIIIDETALSASNVTAYAVPYSGNAVEAIDKLEKTITSDGATFTGSVSGSYKIFIWDENMQPITEKIE